MITFTCPGCGHTKDVPNDFALKKVKCPKCCQTSLIPEPNPQPTAPPPSITLLPTKRVETTSDDHKANRGSRHVLAVSLSLVIVAAVSVAAFFMLRPTPQDTMVQPRQESAAVREYKAKFRTFVEEGIATSNIMMDLMLIERAPDHVVKLKEHFATIPDPPQGFEALHKEAVRAIAHLDIGRINLNTLRDSERSKDRSPERIDLHTRLASAIKDCGQSAKTIFTQLKSQL